MEGEPILKKTLVTMAAMVGACVLFVGTLSIGAVLVTNLAVNPGGSSKSGSDSVAPADKTDRPASTPGKLIAPPAKAAQQI